MSAIETFIRVADQAFWRGQKDQEFRRIGKPGEFFKNLPPEIKEQLASMSSDDFKKVRLDVIDYMLYPPDPRYTQLIQEHYEEERRAYLKKHPYRSVDDEWEPKRFHPGRYRECSRCRRDWQKDRFRIFKEKAVAYKGGCCQNIVEGKLCGYNRCLASLDFHHPDPTEKDPNWRKMRRWAFTRVKRELDKCILVCKNCHAEIHYGMPAS